MAKRVQIIGYDTAGMAAVTGKDREIMVNTSKSCVVVHDNATLGGVEQARADLNNTPDASASNHGRMTAAQVIELTTATANIAANLAAIVSNDSDISALDTDKADKIVPAVTGNVPALDASGNLTDGGKTVAQLNDIVSGTKAVFVQSTAPTGWVHDVSFNDKVLRLVSGATGGATGGSWTISGVTVDGHVLTKAELPHRYLQTIWARANVIGNNGVTDVLCYQSSSNTFSYNIPDNGQDDPHSHGLTSDGSWRPAYADSIVCTRS